MATPEKVSIPTSGGAPMLELADHVHPCVYRPTEKAKMPLLYPTRRLSPEELDIQLAMGRRRSGSFVYYTSCSQCRACEPTRLDVNLFSPTKSMRRILSVGDRACRVEVGMPREDQTRLTVFNRHRLGRGLAISQELYEAAEFSGFLVDSCCESIELSFWDDQRLIGCSVVDCGNESISAVYTYFDPDYSRLSVGTYSILKQIEFAQTRGTRYVYLGMYVADNQHLRYKARFSPQERFINGEWIAFELPMTDWADPRSTTTRW
jgi:arginine-tRNA-protein transferase